MHAADGGGVLAKARPQTQSLQNLGAARGDGSAAMTEMWTIIRAHGRTANGVNQRDPPGLIPCGKQTGQTGADKAAASDSEVVIGCTSQAVINAPTSSGCLGTPVVKTSQPSLVTSTLSSMRMPIPRHFLATCSLSGAMYKPGSTVITMPGSKARHWPSIL